MRPLPRGTLIHDEVHGVIYRLQTKLGQGGFGTAYRAVELNRNGGEKRGSATCIKLSLHADEWHGEVYFCHDLHHPDPGRVAFRQQYDRPPLVELDPPDFATLHMSS